MTQSTLNLAHFTPQQRDQLMQRLLKTRRSAPEAPVQAAETFPPEATPPLAKRRSPASPYLQVETESLAGLIKAGRLPQVDAAALAYWPDDLLNQHRLTRATVIEKTFHQRATVASVLETQWGRIATILLPRLHSELYVDPTLLDAILDALALAGEIGAQSVSLTGLLPSATEYGNKISHAIAQRTDLPRTTTGHALTAASVVLNIGKILEEAGRPLANERVAFLGLGSIGLTSLRLLLQIAPHPRTLLLCDLFHKYHSLQALQTELVQQCGFQGDIQIVPVQQELPPAVYTATLIVGATNVPEVLDVARLQPGTLLVDDSGPHCFNVRQAIDRFTQQHDLLFTEGGAVQLPAPIHQIYHTPPQMETIFTGGELDNPHMIMGCVLSSLLSTPRMALPPTNGPIDPSVCLDYYQALKQLGIQAAPLHCGEYHLAAEAIQRFCVRALCNSQGLEKL